MHKASFLAVLVIMCLLSARTLESRDYLLGWGPRMGATIDPDQVHLGIHLDLGDIAERVRLQPNVEIGFGDNLRVISINPEVFYLFNTRARWTPYAGGGLGINFYDWDSRGRFPNDSDTKLGLNLLGGFETRISSHSKFFTELKFGVSGSPDAKLTIGFTFM